MDKKEKIAVVGVSRSKKKYGFRVFKTLLDHGFRVFPINPNADRILNQRVYPNLSSLPEKPDLVVTVTPPDITERIVDTCMKLGIKKLWLQPGSESVNAIERAKNNGLDVVYNACIMLESQVS